MVYDRRKPDPGPSPEVDASQIQENFEDYDLAFGLNHVPMNSFNQGSHEAIVFKKRNSGPTNVISEIALFNRDVIPPTSFSELFVKIPKFLPTQNDSRQADNVSMQLTFHKVNTAGPQYQSFLFSGYLIYLGSGSGMTAGANVNTSDTITLMLPTPTKILVTLPVANSKNSANEPMRITANITGTNTFDVITSGNTLAAPIPYSFTWTAICLV